MTTRTRAFAFVFAVLAMIFALGLCACGGSGSSGPGQYSGYETRGGAEIVPIRDAAIELGKQRAEAMPSDLTDGKMNEQAKDAFNAANELYRTGKFGEAASAYEAIITEYPKHFGANVNLTLALVQQQKGDDALKQALTCVYLFPGSDGVLLNAQVAAADAKFAWDDVASQITSILDEAGASAKTISDILERGSLSDSYDYNELWMLIETDLADYQSMGSDAKTHTYAEITERLNALLDKGMTNSEDGEALAAYVEAVGTQLGLVGE